MQHTHADFGELSSHPFVVPFSTHARLKIYWNYLELLLKSIQDVARVLLFCWQTEDLK